jgi:hypothetical protein
MYLSVWNMLWYFGQALAALLAHMLRVEDLLKNDSSIMTAQRRKMQL